MIDDINTDNWHMSCRIFVYGAGLSTLHIHAGGVDEDIPVGEDDLFNYIVDVIGIWEVYTVIYSRIESFSLLSYCFIREAIPLKRSHGRVAMLRGGVPVPLPLLEDGERIPLIVESVRRAKG